MYHFEVEGLEQNMIFTFPKAEPHEFNLASTEQLLQMILNYRHQKEIQLKLTVYLNQCINTVFFLEKSSFFQQMG